MADPVVFEFLHAEIVKHIMDEKDEKMGKVNINLSAGRKFYVCIPFLQEVLDYMGFSCGYRIIERCV